MAIGVTTRRVQDIDFIGFKNPGAVSYTRGESERPVYLSDGTDELTKLVMPVLKPLLEQGSKKIVLDLSKVYLVTAPVANMAFSVEAMVDKAGAMLRVMSVPTVCRARKGIYTTEWSEKKGEWQTVFRPRYLDMVSSAKWIGSESEAVEFFNPALSLSTQFKKDGANRRLLIHRLAGDLSVYSRGRRRLASTVLFNAAVLDLSKLEKGSENLISVLQARYRVRNRDPMLRMLQPNSKSTEKLTVRLVNAPEALKEAIFKVRLDPSSSSRELISVRPDFLGAYGTSTPVEFRFFDSVDKALASFGS
jgi:hypothetical protein